MWKGLCALALAVPLSAWAQIDLTTLDREMVGPRTQVLVLGTVHLQAFPEIDPEALDSVLDRLAAFSPTIIAIEALPGEECDLAERHAEKYGAGYCADASVARTSTGLDAPAAMAAVDRTLKAWPAAPTPAQRRRLAALFLAANDRASAYVQWLQLATEERRAGDGLDASLVTMLELTEKRRDESYLLGARLAARLGLQRVHAIDNHTGDRIDGVDRDAFGRSIQAAWSPSVPEIQARDEIVRSFVRAQDFPNLYRYINDSEHLRVLASANVATALRASSPEHFPQIWVGGWEVRNLRMVANLRETFREHPGARVLSIVGASHKPWFDAWLGQLQGVDVVDAQRALGRPTPASRE